VGRSNLSYMDQSLTSSYLFHLIFFFFFHLHVSQKFTALQYTKRCFLVTHLLQLRPAYITNVISGLYHRGHFEETRRPGIFVYWGNSTFAFYYWSFFLLFFYPFASVDRRHQNIHTGVLDSIGKQFITQSFCSRQPSSLCINTRH